MYTGSALYMYIYACELGASLNTFEFFKGEI